MKRLAVATAIAVACLVSAAARTSAQQTQAAANGALYAGLEWITGDGHSPFPRQVSPYVAPLLRPPMSDRLGLNDSFDAAIGYAKSGSFPQLGFLPWVTFGAGVATVDYDRKLRLGGSVSLEIDRLTTVMFVESAYGRVWHRVETSLLVTPALRIGSITDAYAGNGARVEAYATKLHIAIIGTTLVPPKSQMPNGSIGIRVPF